MIDIGAGDGHTSLSAARADSRTLAVALDPSTDQLMDGARIALRQKIANVMFVVSSIENAPRELERIADEITINFAWGSLLRGIVRAEAAVLGPLARIAKPGAPVRILLSVAERDAAGVGLEAVDADSLARNGGAYASAGLTLARCAIATTTGRASGSSWSKRLAADRQVIALTLRRER